MALAGRLVSEEGGQAGGGQSKRQGGQPHMGHVGVVCHPGRHVVREHRHVGHEARSSVGHHGPEGSGGRGHLDRTDQPHVVTGGHWRLVTTDRAWSRDSRGHD